jgi:predicted PurR-regulated permease PerM
MAYTDPPTPFQKKVCWAGLTAVAGLAAISVILLAGWSIVSLCAYLKPVLTPIAIAAVLAYLMTPLVTILCRWRLPRTWAVVAVFIVFTGGVVLIALTVAPALERQAGLFADRIPAYRNEISSLAKELAAEVQTLNDIHKKSPRPNSPLEDFSPENIKIYGIELATQGLSWVQEKLPTIASATGTFLQNSIGGVFGLLGFLLSLVLVPVFLFFFLLESPEIAANWSRYLPLRASPLKVEIVSLFNEINDYLIHFFRGQLLVSLIDGAIVGVALFIFLRLDFAFLIGLMVGILCLIPYLGMVLCIIPALLIALAQYGDLWHPFWVIVIFFVAHTLDGIFISPKVIGNSVGLHPMTVIISVFGWTIVLGGLLGALLAVPLTATMKVLLRRYFWDRPPHAPIPQPSQIIETAEKKTTAVTVEGPGEPG